MTSPLAPALRRTLRDFEPLLPAEAALLQALAAGGIAKIGYRRPAAASIEVNIRAEFLACLACGGGGAPQGDAPSLQVLGAWVTGRLNLIEAAVPMSLWFYRCGFAATPLLDGARVQGDVSFPDCTLPGLRAQACTIAGTLALNAGCAVAGAVRLERASVGGDLDCDRAQLCTGERATDVPRPLVADDARISGNVLLRGGLRAHGEMRFVGARIGGDLCASFANLTAGVDADGGRGIALNLDAVRVAGDVLLNAGFAAGGQVRLRGARIDGDLDCTEAAFDVVGDAAWDGGAALLLDRAHIGGTLVLQRLQTPLQGGSLTDARAGALADDASSWGQQHLLDGFSYRRLGRGAPTDTPSRLNWLLRQHALHLGEEHRPQPWRQLIGALRQMGHEASADDVAIGRERHLRSVGRIGTAAPAALRWLVRWGHALFGFFAGYGHRPWRLVAWLVVLWLACGGLYWLAADQEVMAPATVAGDKAAQCGVNTPAGPGPECSQPLSGTPRFNPLVYSLDVLLPGLDLRQQGHWAPARDTPLGTATLALTWAEALLGWLGGLTLIAAMAGLTDRDRRR